VLKNKISLRSSELPQVLVDGVPPDVRHFQYLLLGLLGDLRAAVQVDGPQQFARVGQVFQALVGDGVALANVQHLEVAQRLGYVQHAVVGYLARTQRQGVQAVQAVGHVQQRLVADLVAERHVKAAQLGAPLGQVPDADVGDVVARAQVELVQRVHARHVVEPRVGDVHAEAEVESTQRAQALGHVLEALVGDVLAVL